MTDRGTLDQPIIPSKTCFVFLAHLSEAPLPSMSGSLLITNHTEIDIQGLTGNVSCPLGRLNRKAIPLSAM